MEWVKRKLSLSKRKKDGLSPWYMENGGKLLEGLIASSNGKYDVPYRVFSIEELNKALNLDCTQSCLSSKFMADKTGYYLHGTFHHRQILVKKSWDSDGERDGWQSYVVNDIVVSLQMSRHKNVLKVLGCCLDLKVPAIIYEPGINYRLLHGILFSKKEGNSQKDGRLLSWSSRLKIARDVANALVFLHTGFRTPIIHRDLTAGNIVIDHHGVAKLVDFSLCIALPLGESHLIEDEVVRRTSFAEPDYIQTGIITEKTDVYMFGIILLQLLTGCGAQKPTLLNNYTRNHINKNEFSRILDPAMLVEGVETGQEPQLLAFSELGLRCTCEKGDERPEMIDVAKEILRIQRSVHPS